MSKKKKGAIAGVAAAVVIVCAAGAGNATYTINEQEQAVVTTFGVSHAVTDPGLHFKIPFVQHVTKVNTTIQSLRIGYDNNNDVVADESIMITSDFNFVDVDFYLEYRVSDPVKAVYASKDPDLILQNIAQSCIRAAISNYDVDSVLNQFLYRISESLGFTNHVRRPERSGDTNPGSYHPRPLLKQKKGL